MLSTFADQSPSNPRRRCVPLHPRSVFLTVGEVVKVLDVRHSRCNVSSSRLPRVVELTAEITAVCLFLATILGSVSLFFTIEARVASHKFRFLGFGVLLSSASGGIDV